MLWIGYDPVPFRIVTQPRLSHDRPQSASSRYADRGVEEMRSSRRDREQHWAKREESQTKLQIIARSLESQQTQQTDGHEAPGNRGQPGTS
jgi:hypothetical protein